MATDRWYLPLQFFFEGKVLCSLLHHNSSTNQQRATCQLPFSNVLVFSCLSIYQKMGKENMSIKRKIFLGGELELPTSVRPLKKQESSRKTSTSALWMTSRPLTMWITTNWKILQEMGIPDHLNCILRNLYVSQEATVRIGHGVTVQFSPSVVSNSLRPHELQHARPPCPSPTPRVYSNG